MSSCFCPPLCIVGTGCLWTSRGGREPFKGSSLAAQRLPQLPFDGPAQLQAVPPGGPRRVPQHGLHHGVVQSPVALGGEAVDGEHVWPRLSLAGFGRPRLALPGCCPRVPAERLGGGHMLGIAALQLLAAWRLLLL